MKNLFITLILLLVFPIAGEAQLSLDRPLPQDTAMLIGKLPNGITYYIRRNSEPKGRASFYIIRHAGALLENDAQNGLAHFLEHMSFNGTKHFPGNSLVKILERHGVAFGQNLNAYTDTDETVYNISDVPTYDTALIDTCLLILHDWSYYVSLNSEDIDKERGVISEEWRTVKDADSRIRSQFMPVLFKGSMFGVRNVIGDLNVIKNFQYDELREFYHTWYRTDLQAIAIVGDFDSKQMEKKIIALFSTIPAIDHPKPRPKFEVPVHQETYYVLATDREVQQSSIHIYTLFPSATVVQRQAHVSIKDNFVTTLFSAMINNRIKEEMQRGTAPYLSASIDKGPMVSGYDAYTISVFATGDKEQEALTGVLAENERALRYGFTATELVRAKATVKAPLDLMYANKNKTDNDSYIEEIRSNFLNGSPMVDIEYYYPFAQKVLEEITPDDIVEAMKKWNGKENRTLVVVAKEDNGKHLTQERILAIEREVAAAPLKRYDDSFLSRKLINEELKGSKVVKTKHLPQFDGVQWTLSNGAVVAFRKTEYDKELVSVTALSPGGISLYGRDMIPSVKMAAYAPLLFGLGEYDASALERMLAGKVVQSNLSVGSVSESLNGSSTPRDFETLMQLIYLQFERPRFDRQRFKIQMERERSSIANAESDITKIMRDSLNAIMNNYSERLCPLNQSYLESITLEKVKRAYRERFSNAADFTFIIVGNIEENFALEMAEKYIGSISSTGHKERWVDNGVRGPKGKTVKVIPIDFQIPKAKVVINITRPTKYSPWNSIRNSILAEILKLRYTTVIREQEGGSYGVDVTAGNAHEPIHTYTLDINFECDPARVDYLKSLVYKELKKMSVTPPAGEELSIVVKTLMKNNQQSKYSNSYWEGIFYGYYKMGINFNDSRNFENLINKITPVDIQIYAKKIYEKSDIVDVTFIHKL